MRVLTLSNDAIIPVPGVIWRSCTFAPDAAARLVHPQETGALVIDLPPDLLPAGEARRSEFLAGRLCATLALRAAGSGQTVGRNGRAPVWPEGVTGSITHTATRAMTVVSRSHSGIGIDCEGVMDDQTLAEVAPLVMAPQDWAMCPVGLSRRVFATIIFSAKEALYKALSARIGDLPEFREAELAAFTPAGPVLRFRKWRLQIRSQHDCRNVVTLACVD